MCHWCVALHRRCLYSTKVGQIVGRGRRTSLVLVYNGRNPQTKKRNSRWPLPIHEKIVQNFGHPTNHRRRDWTRRNVARLSSAWSAFPVLSHSDPVGPRHSVLPLTRRLRRLDTIAARQEHHYAPVMPILLQCVAALTDSPAEEGSVCTSNRSQYFPCRVRLL